MRQIEFTLRLASVMSVSQLTVIVPARSGSKGLPGKNFLRIGGLPLFEHAVNIGVELGARVIVATDSDALTSGLLTTAGEVYRRSDESAVDSAPMSLLIGELIEEFGLEQSTLVLLQPTSPLRTLGDVYGAIEVYKSGDHDLVMSVCTHDSTLLKTLTLTSEGTIQPISKPEFLFSNRQSLPPVYKPNGALYIFSASDFMKNNDFPVNNIGSYIMPKERSHDIDDLADFDMVKDLMNANFSDNG